MAGERIDAASQSFWFPSQKSFLIRSAFREQVLNDYRRSITPEKAKRMRLKARGDATGVLFSKAEKHLLIICACFLTRTIVLDMILICAAAQTKNRRKTRKEEGSRPSLRPKARVNSGKKICNSCPLKAYKVVKHLKGCFPCKRPSPEEETA